MRLSRQAFTFVELIVVLVIIAILTMIGFTAYESYIASGRDTKRIVEGNELRTAFQEYALKNKLPDPDEKISLLASGALYTTQGFLSASLIKMVGLKGSFYDKEYETYPVYTLSINKKDFQFLTYIEDQINTSLTVFPQSFAAPAYNSLFPITFGKPIGIVLLSSTMTPINSVYSGSYDIITGGQDIEIYMSDTQMLDSKKNNLWQILPQNSCKRIMELGYAKGSGIYTLMPDGKTKIQAYCDMETEGAGWTLIARAKGGTSIPFGWLQSGGNLKDTNSSYSLGAQSINMAFQEIRFHSTNKVVWTQGFDVKDLRSASGNLEIGQNSKCTILQNPLNIASIPCYVSWGRVNLSDRFCFNTDFGDGAPSSSCSGISKDAYIGRNNEGVRGLKGEMYVR